MSCAKNSQQILASNLIVKRDKYSEHWIIAKLGHAEIKRQIWNALTVVNALKAHETF